MTPPDQPREEIELLMEEYLERRRLGERPTIAEYVEKHPALAAEIIDLFPALVVLENADAWDANATASLGQAASGQPLERLGDYRIVREIGRGGMGIVYEAVQESLNRSVALKVLPDRLSTDPNRLQRFRREARSAARLHHTAIVPVFDVGSCDGIHYFAMQYIVGHSLNEVLVDIKRIRTDQSKAPSGSTISVGLTGGSGSTSSDGVYHRSVARIGQQIAEALAYAHSQKILHRDIKPSNIILDKDGAAWVTDFGLAKEEGEDLTQTGDVIGTLRYMPPERFAGNADARSDIYSLGLTLYEMLTLQPAFDDSDRGRLIRNITLDDPRRPSSIDPRVPHDLETIVLKAMAKEPDHRYQNSQELADDLHRFLTDRPIYARRTSAREQLWRWCRRNPVAASFAGVALAALIALAVISTASAISLRSQFEQLQQAERDTRLEVGKAMLAQGAANLRTGLAGRREESLKLFRQANEILQGDPRGQEVLPALRDQVICARHVSDLSELAERSISIGYDIGVDAQMEHYAVAEWKTREIVVRSIADNKEIRRLPGAEKPYWHGNPTFSPSGQYLKISYNVSGNEPDQLDVWRLNGPEKVLSLTTPILSFAFHPDGRTFAAFADSGELRAWDLVDRKQLRRIAVGPEFATIAFDPSGHRLALLALHWDKKNVIQKPSLRILDFPSGRELVSWTEDVGNTCLCWSSDGRFVAMGTVTGETIVRDTTDAAFVTTLRGHVSASIECQFAPGSYLLATSSWDKTTRLWDAVSGECMAVANGRIRSLFSNDGRLAFSRASSIGNWHISEMDECLSLTQTAWGQPDQQLGQYNWAHAAEFSPDGKLIAVGSEGGVLVFDSFNGEKLATLVCPRCYTVLFEADGGGLLTYSDTGVQRWPISAAAANGRDRIGPSATLFAPEVAPSANRRAAWLPMQSGLAITDDGRSVVYLLDISRSRTTALQLAELPAKYRRFITVSVSPDGRWLATGGWKDGGIQVWNLPERRFERLLQPGDGKGNEMFRVAFAPDGRLVAATHTDTLVGYYAFQPGTWERTVIAYAPDSGMLGPAVFAPNGQFMALAMSPTEIRLAELGTGRPLANLIWLGRSDPTPLAFSPDGTRLAVATNRGAVEIWDLRSLRQRLAEWNLDWTDPPARVVR
jgi:WD40 repeat protein